MQNHEEIVEAIEASIRRPDTLGLIDAGMQGIWIQKSVESLEDTLELSLKEVITSAVAESPLVMSPLHGWHHWMSVYRNGLVLGNATLEYPFSRRKGEEFDVILMMMLFALFHDCRRNTEGWCNLHGAWGAVALHATVGDVLWELPEARAAVHACNMHTIVEVPKHKTEGLFVMQEGEAVRDGVGLCLDADRLDLTRLGMMPDPDRLWHGRVGWMTWETMREKGGWNG